MVQFPQCPTLVAPQPDYEHEKAEDEFWGEEQEWLWHYCREVEDKQHHDFYIFGHRHLSLNLTVTPNSRYINLGEWVHNRTYGVFDGNTMRLEHFK